MHVVSIKPFVLTFCNAGLATSTHSSAGPRAMYRAARHLAHLHVWSGSTAFGAAYAVKQGATLRRFAQSSTVSPSLYGVLGITSSATQAEIRTAYIKSCKACHPDVISADDAAKRRFIDVQNAYNVLSGSSMQ